MEPSREVQPGTVNGRVSVGAYEHGSRQQAQRPFPGSKQSGLRSLVIFHSADVSGPSRSLEAELRWLAEQGPMGVLLPEHGALKHTFGALADVSVKSFSTLTVPGSPMALGRAGQTFWRTVREIRAEINRFAPDLILLSSALLTAPMLAARLEGIKPLTYAGEIIDEPRRPSLLRTFVGGAVLDFASRSSTGVIACSDRVGRQYSRRGASPVELVRPPIARRYEEGDGQRLRRELEIDPDVPVIASVGALSHGRGQDVLIRSMEEIRGVIDDAILVVVGKPHLRDVDQTYASHLKLLADQVAPGAVRFAGFRERVEDAYAASFVVVNPTRAEGFGRVAFEAALAGRPVVSTNVGAIPEVLRDEVDALLVPPDSPGHIADAVVRLHRDEVLSRRLSNSGSAKARRELCPDDSLRAFKEIVVSSVCRSHRERLTAS